MTDTDDRWAAAERHLSEGEANLARLEEVITEMARHDRAAAGPLASSALVPLRRGVAEVRERLAALRAERRPPAAAKDRSQAGE
jgi:hypothetical protein